MDELTDDEDFLQLINIFDELVPVLKRRIRHRPRKYRTRKNGFLYFEEDEFIARYRLPKHCVHLVANLIAPEVSSITNWNHAVTVEEQLLVTLRYFATGSLLQAGCDFHGLHKTTTGKIIKKVSQALAKLGRANIKMPTTEEDIKATVQHFYRISEFPCCVGALGCTHIKIQSPGGTEAEIYRNHKDYFSLNCQVICNANLVICDIVCRWPGSAHDSTIFNNSNIRARFERGEFGNNLLVADGGYPIKPYLMTPLHNPRTRAEQLYNNSQVCIRNHIETCFGVWKRRFPILTLGIKINIQTVEAVVVATAFLHNIAGELNLPDPPVAQNILETIDDNNAGGVSLPATRAANNDNFNYSRDYFERLID